MNRGRAFGSEHVTDLEVRDGMNTYMLAYLPDDRVIGNVSVSR